jgi:hypothetical protein
MVKVIRSLQDSLNKHKIVWRAVGALSLGILLGALVAVPYDQILGLSVPPYTGRLYTAVQSLIATATVVRVWVMDNAELAFRGEPDTIASSDK